LKMQRGGQVMWRVDLYLEFAMGLDQLGNRRDANELSVVDDRDARADLLDLAQHMAGDENGLARRSEVPKQIAHLDDSSWVEPVRGFVEDQKIGIVEQCDGKAQPLLHAQRVSPHTVAIAAFQRNDLEHLVDALVRNAPQHVSDDLEVEPVDRQTFAVGLGQRLSAKYRLRGAHCESSTARAGFVTVGLV